MYESFYGLRERPFDLALNPKSLLLTPQHREALGNLEYGIRERVGVIVLIGEAGTGKTTLLRTAFARAEAERPGSTVAWASLRNPTIQRDEFLEFLSTRFGLAADVAGSKMRVVDELERILLGGLRAALIIDEAQSVPLELLEEIRLLGNIESDSQKLLPIVLAGQPELAERLNHPSLRQLKQRVALRCSLTALTLQETAAYISARVLNAGGQPASLFSREAVVMIHERSRGIPRTINVLCENALMTGYAEEQRPVGRNTVETVCRDFDFERVTAGEGSDPNTPPAQRVPSGRRADAEGPVLLEPKRWGWGVRRRSS